MNLRAKETAQSTVRAINELVGEATDRIEDVLPKVEALPKKIEGKIEGVLPSRKKRSHKRRNIGAVLVTAIVAAVAFVTLRRKSTPTQAAASNYRAANGAPSRPSETASDLDRERQPAGSRN
jgi:ferric-dicitrate binding protein FerR (iron transport regulator)